MTGFRKLCRWIASLFTSIEPDKPSDLRQFEEAQTKLHNSARALSKEADAFGDLVRDMRGDTKRKKPCNKKRKASKS